MRDCFVSAVDGGDDGIALLLTLILTSQAAGRSNSQPLEPDLYTLLPKFGRSCAKDFAGRQYQSQVRESKQSL